MYDLMIQSNIHLFEEDKGTIGGTERQILTVSEELVKRGVDVAILHSLKDGSDKVINGVKHLNKYRHHYDYSKVRVHVNQQQYVLNAHSGIIMQNLHVPHVSSIEINCSQKIFQWFHNWFYMYQNIIPRIFNSKAVQRYVYEGPNNPYSSCINPLPDDQMIYYMVPKDMNQKPQKKRDNYLFWMSAFGKGMKEAVLMYISLYERGLTDRPFRICIPPQVQKIDVDICWQMIHDVGRKRYPIEFLGELEYQDALFQLSNAACLFRAGSPQETFGLVYLEANRLEVPVLTYAGDAGEEILTDKHNFIIDKDSTLQNISDWLVNIEKKKTSVDMSRFEPELISKQWIELIENA
jgi:glycosyltransferase involved in cell wall biosynthesis